MSFYGSLGLLKRLPIADEFKGFFGPANGRQAFHQLPVPGQSAGESQDLICDAGVCEENRIRKTSSMGLPAGPSTIPFRIKARATTGVEMPSMRAWGNATPSSRNVDPCSSRCKIARKMSSQFSSLVLFHAT